MLPAGSAAAQLTGTGLEIINNAVKTVLGFILFLAGTARAFVFWEKGCSGNGATCSGTLLEDSILQAEFTIFSNRYSRIQSSRIQLSTEAVFEAVSRQLHQ